MKTVLQTIRMLVIILFVDNLHCQEGFSDHDLLRLQQIANDGQIETITSYSTNIIQRDPNSHSISSVSVQYHTSDDAEKNQEYNRADRGRSKKVFRIKNPFQHQSDDNERQQESNSSLQDNTAGASNQYAAMQYSLPPEDFLQQMRAENQFYQQQISTQVPNLGYTATPQPQFQFSTHSSSLFDNSNQQSNQIPQLEPKISHSQNFLSNSNSFPYNNPSFGIDNVHSTPSPVPPYLSTSLSNNQYVATPSNPYVSSSSPLYLSSPQNLQSYVSSPLSQIQSGTPDFSNKITTTIGSNSLNFDNSDINKKIQLDHYDNSVNGIRYPYQSEFSTSTVPSASTYADPTRDSWHNALNVGVNTLSKSLQEVSLSQYQNSPYNSDQHDGRLDSSFENSNDDTHRIGNLPSANNMFMNFAQPNYQVLNNIKSRTRDLEQEIGQPDIYSHGDFGWKLNDKKPLTSQDSFSSGSYPRQQSLSLQSDSPPVSQMSFHMDTGRQRNFDQISKSASDNLEAQEFAREAAKAHENLKIQQQSYGYNYPTNINQNNALGNLGNLNSYGSNSEKQRNKFYSLGSDSNPFSFSNSQTDLITAPPYHYLNLKDNNLETKIKYPFDHAKALKNIVSMDVSNVVPNSDSQIKDITGLDANNRLNTPSYSKDQIEQNLKQYYKPIADAYYRDKNTGYGFNLKSKPDDFSSNDKLKQLQLSMGYNEGGFSSYSDSKHYVDGTAQPSSYISSQGSSSYQDSVQSPGSIQQILQRPQNQVPSSDMASFLKLNDIPHRLTQSLPLDAMRLHNSNFDQGNIPTPVPAKLNQNVDSHQIDVTNSILSKLMLNKQHAYNRPEIDSQSSGLDTINGFRIANPFNVDLKLVAEMLKGKQADQSHVVSLREQFRKPSPIKLDISQLQQLLMKNDQYSDMGLPNGGLGSLSNSFLDVYSNDRFPYQGVKYSRSQEEEESIVPIADASNNHPIGAVMEQEEPASEREVSTGSDATANGEESNVENFTEGRPNTQFNSGYRGVGERHRHPNSLIPGRHSFQRKHPKSDVAEPYPLLKPPPRPSRVEYNRNRNPRRRRISKTKFPRVLKTEALFEAESSGDRDPDSEIQTLLRPPPPKAEAKSDVDDAQSK